MPPTAIRACAAGARSRPRSSWHATGTSRRFPADHRGPGPPIPPTRPALARNLAAQRDEAVPVPDPRHAARRRARCSPTSSHSAGRGRRSASRRWPHVSTEQGHRRGRRTEVGQPASVLWLPWAQRGSHSTNRTCVAVGAYRSCPPSWAASVDGEVQAEARSLEPTRAGAAVVLGEHLGRVRPAGDAGQVRRPDEQAAALRADRRPHSGPPERRARRASARSPRAAPAGDAA